MTTAAEPLGVEAPLWRPIASAMGKTGGASLAGGLLSALGTKFVALLLGPGAVALLATLQQLRDGAVTCATANGRTAIVQGASALTGTERREYLRTAALLMAGGTLFVAVAMAAVPKEIVRWSGLPAGSEALLPWLAATVALLSVFVFLSAILNALKKIGKLALAQLAAPAATAVVAWPLAMEVRSGHRVAMIFFLAIPAASASLAVVYALRSHRAELRSWFLGPGRCWAWRAARGFLSISGAMLASGLVATAVLLAARASITRQEGLAMTGQFDAAWNISMNQVTLILGSVQTYYLPSLAAEPSAARRGRQIRSMLMMTTLAAVPAMAALAALKPLAISLLYSHAFSLSPQFLRWTLVGDYLKVSSWVLATPMLAMRDVGTFLALDLAAQAIFLGSGILLARIWRPSESVAIGFLLSYAVYFALCYAYARARHEFRFGATGFSAWLGGLALLIAVSALSWSDTTVHPGRATGSIVAAVLFSAGFAAAIRTREA